MTSSDPLPSVPPEETGMEATDRDGNRYPIGFSDCLDDETERLMTRLAFGPDVPEATENLRVRIRELVAASPLSEAGLKTLLEAFHECDERSPGYTTLSAQILGLFASLSAPLPEEPSTKCWTCGAPVVVTKGYDNGLTGAAKIASADTLTYAPPASPEPPELKEALDELVQRAKSVGCAVAQENWAIVGSCELQASYARAALVAIYDRQREETARLRGEVDWCEQSAVITDLQAELERLKAEQMTAEEAQHALDQIPDNQCGWPPKDCPVCDSLREKLRSQSDTGAHQE